MKKSKHSKMVLSQAKAGAPSINAPLLQHPNSPPNSSDPVVSVQTQTQTPGDGVKKEQSNGHQGNGYMALVDKPKKTIMHQGVEYEIEGFPGGKAGLLLGCWITILICAVCKNELVDCGTAGYFLLTFLPFPVLLLVTYAFGRYMLKLHGNRPAESYAKGDIHWDSNNVIKYPIMSSVAGVAAALLGVGGGMVTGPLMLELGVLPEVSRVTSAFMILFTSSCTSMQYLILGKIQADEAIWYMAWGFVGAVFGHYCVEYLLKKYNSTSVLVYLLAWAVLASAIAMGSVDIVDVVENGFTGFTPVCAS